MPSKAKSGAYKRLQLYNPNHKKDILILFDNDVRPFDLEQERGKEEEDNDKEFQVSDDEEEEGKVDVDVQAQAVADKDRDEGKLACSSCLFKVDYLDELREHCKLDWHRYNVKRRQYGQGPVVETTFYEMMDDLSSIEGSDSSEDEASTTDTGAAVSRLMERLARIPLKEEEEVDKDKKKSKERVKLVNSPKMYFENGAGQVFGLYKSVAEALGSTGEEFLKCFDNPLNTAVIMVSGGHFAAAIFKGSDVLVHKTFHSYTVRARQGGSQGTRDSKSATSHPKSAGASLRRYNEQVFAQHVQDLVEAWRTQLAGCPTIFFRAVGSSSSVLFGGKMPPFQKNDTKLRTIPFQTKRPTFAEVKRVHSLLTVLHVYDDRAKFLEEHLKVPQGRLERSPKRKATIDRAKTRSPKPRDDPCPYEPAIEEESNSSEEETGPGEMEECMESVDFSHLKEYDDSLTQEQRQSNEIRRKRNRVKQSKSKPIEIPRPSGTLGLILDTMNSTNPEPDELNNLIESLENEYSIISENDRTAYLNQPVDIEESNILHIAAHRNFIKLVWVLLDLGCDPACKNKAGKVPYNFANTKDCRDEFRRFMGQYPDKFDYKKAQVPAPLTEEMEAEKAEKKKLLNKLKREKEKHKKQEKMGKEKEKQEKDRYLQLSDREKRALAAEQRILAQCKRNGEKIPTLVRCFECAVDMTGKVPFEYNQNVFCTTKCLASHRKKFPTPLPN